MYYFLSLLCGVIVSVMIVINGALTSFYGVNLATVIIHIVGLAITGLLVICRREKPFARRAAWYWYLGGVLGVGTTVCNNYAFGRVSVSAILALGLLGQAIGGLVVDQFGLMGMAKHRFVPSKLLGLSLVICGVGCMLTGAFEPIAAAASFFSGITVLASRSFNARLTDVAGVSVSTLFNYITGLLTASVVLLISRGAAFIPPAFSPNAWIYMGGALGVATVILCNVTVSRISAFYLTLFLFIGQVFSGVALDALIDGAFSARNLVGGCFVALGLTLDLVLERRHAGKPV